MSEAGGRPEEALVSLLARSATGALEVRSGRKRWIFYVSSGRLVFTRSNLKSEAADAIRAELTSPTRAGIILAQAARRVRNAMRGEGQEWSIKEGESPSKTLEIPTSGALIEGIRDALDESTLRELAAELLQGWPRLAADALVDMGGDEVLESYFNEIDGERSGEDVILFAPGGDIKRALAAMWVSWKMGSIEVGSEPVQDAPAGLGLDLGFDLDAVLAEATAPAPKTEAPGPDAGPIIPPTFSSDVPEDLGEPSFELDFEDDSDSDEAEYEAAVMSALGSSTAPDPEPAPVPEPAPAPEPAPEPAPAPESAPESDEETTSTAAAAVHPMAERLHALTERVNSAENHFEALGLPWDSPLNEFRAAYRDLARDLHPDRYVDASDDLQDMAMGVFDKVREAFEVIESEEERQKYTDKVIHGKKTEDELAMEQLNSYWAAEADFKKGLAAFNQGKLTSAHDCFTRAVDVVPDELEFRAYHSYTSFALERTRNPERALEYIDTLKSVIERNQEQERKLDAAWVLLGRAYRESGEQEKAKRCIVQALRINASNADATREMRRLTNPERKSKPEDKKKGGFFSKFFGKK